MGKYGKKLLCLGMSAILMTIPIVGCSGGNDEEETTTNNPTGTEIKQVEKLKITLDENTKYQTMESFGASGAWWSQDVGGWTELNDDGVEIREQIATLLFDKENGIGLSAYRYNIGAGSADSGASFDGITDVWRRAESFETEAGVYDWSKDENAQWFLGKAKDMGVSEMVFFCNSPLERLTKNGKAYGNVATGGEKTSNLPEENYREYAEYVMDVVEHFVSEGYPIKYISPINEPQWDWTGGQEGCHFEPAEVVNFLNVFLDVMEERNVEGVELSAPELGEWGNTSYPYYQAIFADERLAAELTSLDVHSYWSDMSAKNGFLEWLELKGLTNLDLKMSEWCEMVNGKDMTMDSAINMSKEIIADLTKLNVSTWQYWIAVSCYNYRDGLIYVNANTKDVWETKRLWAMGNYSRFIRPGYTRIEASSDNTMVCTTAFTGTSDDGKENLVIVLTNCENTALSVDGSQFEGWTSGEIYVTDDNHSLESVQKFTSDESIELSGNSVTTITLYR